MKKSLAFLALAVLLFAGMGAAFDGFEDGNDDGWTCNAGGGCSVKSDEPYAGTYYYETEATGGGSISKSLSEKSPSGLSIAIQRESTEEGQIEETYAWRDGGTNIIYVETNQNDDSLFLHDGTELTGTTTDTWTIVNFTGIDWSTDTIGEIYVDGTSVATNKDFKNSAPHIDEFTIPKYNKGTTATWRVLLDNVGEYNPNAAPTIDSNTTRPAPDQIQVGDSVDTVMNASDTDGDDLQGWSNVSFSNGTIIDFSVMDEPTANNFQIPDQITSIGPADSVIFVNFTAGDGTANTTSSLKIDLSEEPAEVNIIEPENATFFDFNNTWRVRILDDGDAVPEERITCQLFNDSSPFTEVTAFENDSQSDRTFNGILRHDLGQGNFTSGCRDEAGDSSNTSVIYTVDDFNFTRFFSDSSQFETVTENFEVDIEQGFIAEAFNITLFYDDSPVNRTFVEAGGNAEIQEELNLDIPLVDGNSSLHNWTIEVNVTREEFTDSSAQDFTKENGSRQNQTVNWSYFVKRNELLDADIIEGELVQQNITVMTHTKKADLSGTMNFTQNPLLVDLQNRTGFYNNRHTVFLGEDRSTNLTGVNSVTEHANSTINISFKNDFRTLEANDNVNISRIRFDDCTDLNTQALQFEVFDEENRTDKLTSDIQWAVEVWKHPSVKKTFSNESDGQETHTFCIAPSDAEYTIDSTQKLIQYQDSAENYRLRSYFLINETISSTVTEIDLFTLLIGDSNRITLETVDDGGDELAGTIIRAERYYPSDDKSISVLMTRTGAQGTSKTSFNDLEEVFYSFKFYRDRNGDGIYELVDTAPQQVIDSDTIRFTIGDDAVTFFDFRESIGFSCSEASTWVNCSYSAQESIRNMTLTVKELAPISDVVLCRRSSTSVSGELICDVDDGLNASETQFIWSLNAVTPNGNTVFLTSGTSEEGGGIGDIGIVITMFMFLTLGFAGLAGPRPVPELGVALSALAIIASYAMGWFPITYQAAATFVILAAVTIYRMRSRRGGGVL